MEAVLEETGASKLTAAGIPLDEQFPERQRRWGTEHPAAPYHRAAWLNAAGSRTANGTLIRQGAGGKGYAGFLSLLCLYRLPAISLGYI